MPIAEKFKALGMGNGFTHCLDKVNVAPNNKWITLGGFKKEDIATQNTPTKAQLDLSLSNAMKLFWNLNGITFDFTSTYSFVDPANITIDGSTDIDNRPSVGGSDKTEITWELLGGGYTTSNQKPHERVKYKRGSISKSPYDSSSQDIYNFNLTLRIGYIYRMYNGDINDESKFLGYGANLYNSSENLYQSYWSLGLASTNTEAGELGYPQTSKYVVLNGIHLVADFYNYYLQGVDSSISNPLDSVVAVYTSEQHSETYTLSNLNFYTYP